MRQSKTIISLLCVSSVLCTDLTHAYTPTQMSPPGIYLAAQTQKKETISEAAQYLIDKGIIKGVTQDNYALGSYVKRGDLMIMLLRAFKLQGSAFAHFTDVPDSSYYSYAIGVAQSLKIANGQGDTFKPDDYVTYKEVQAFVERTISAITSNSAYILDSDLIAIYKAKKQSAYATRSDIAELFYPIMTSYGKSMQTTGISAAILQNINYTTQSGKKTTLKFSDLKNACKDKTDDDLSYIQFTLPPADSGTLYYNYKSDTKYESLVSADTAYNASTSPSISKVSFVSPAYYIGTVRVPYKGYTKKGTAIAGTIRFMVDENVAAVTTQKIAYSTNQGAAISFSAKDFNQVCVSKTRESISFIQFSPPDSKTGYLYYAFSPQTKTGAPVQASDRITVDSNITLSDIVFQPALDYSGTVKIPYTGFTTNNHKFYGSVEIKVSKLESDKEISVKNVAYVVPKNTPYFFSAGDLEDVCKKATKESLSYVSFTIPSIRTGTLYYNYESSSNPGTKVSSTKLYYVGNSPYISKIAFVPVTGFLGTDEIRYTGFTENGRTYKGIIRIAISPE